jgi:PhoPQ-activated pathogenicity-related protein
MWSAVLLALCVSLAGAQSEIPDFGWDEPTELDEYVHRDDGEWTWEVIGEERFDYVTVHLINMTSQRWMAHDEGFASRQVWWHIMGIAVPDEVDWNEHGALFIGSGNNNMQEPPARNSYWNVVASSYANDTKMVAAYILQVPNQPILFRDDPKQNSRSEDNYIAYTWRWAYDAYTGDMGPEDTPFEVVARCPMTKAAKRGLDTIAAFAAENVPDSNIDKFFVMGASKRGWTTWSLAAVDQRVIGIFPLVFSLLKMEETVMHHYQTMGGAWSFAFGPYFNEDLTYHLTEQVASDVLYKLEDPFRYRTRLSTIPKVMIVASGDEFFFCSDSHSWWSEISAMGPMYMMMNPNAEHVLFPHWLRIYRTIVGFSLNIINGDELPNVRTERGNDENGGYARIVVEGEQPQSVRAMRSMTIDDGERRDWRLVAGHPDREVHPVTWNVTEHTEDNGVYECRAESDPEGVEWTGCFVEGTFEYAGYPMYITSEVMMTPDTYPVEPCEGEDCYGYLV